MEKLYKTFDFTLLDANHYTEESVREDLISPLIRALGYSNSGNTAIIRNFGLKHPFVTIGSTSRPIRVIPDYLMKVAGQPAWVLEAKSPREDIKDSKHTQQAYSYAIHPEIRVNYFGLCNGKELIIYQISEYQPMFHIPLRTINTVFSLIKELLSPETVFKDHQFKPAKDLGLHFKRLGLKQFESIILLQLQLLVLIKYDDNLYSFSSPIAQDAYTYMGTFDFDDNTVGQLEPLLGSKKMEIIKRRVIDKWVQFHLDEVLLINCRVTLPETDNLIENDKEIFLPLRVTEFETVKRTVSGVNS